MSHSALPDITTKPTKAASSSVLPGDHIQDARDNITKQGLPPSATDSPPVATHTSFLNGRVLPLIESVNNWFISNLSMHRFYAAALFTVGLVVGDKVAQVPFGKDFAHVKLAPEKVNRFLKPIYNTLAYESNSPVLRDRWLRVAHLGAIGLTGGLGTLLASRYFFQSRAEKLKKEHSYLDEFEELATFEQSRAWELPTALSSIPGSAMGFTHLPFIPFINYGASQASRYVLASGQKIVAPGLGKLLTNSHSAYRFGPSGLIDYMISYATYNNDQNPPELNAMAQGILLPWFPKATPAQVEAFVQEVQAIRMHHYNQVGIPAEKKEACKQELTERFHKAGLEETLLKIGLNPEEAVIANNGFIGASAEKMGAGRKLKELRQQYVKAFRSRHPELTSAQELGQDALVPAVETPPPQTRPTAVEQEGFASRLGGTTRNAQALASREPLSHEQRTQTQRAASAGVALGV